METFSSTILDNTLQQLYMYQKHCISAFKSSKILFESIKVNITALKENPYGKYVILYKQAGLLIYIFWGAKTI